MANNYIIQDVFVAKDLTVLILDKPIDIFDSKNREMILGNSTIPFSLTYNERMITINSTRNNLIGAHIKLT